MMFGIRIRIATKNTSKFAAIAFQSGTFRMIFSQTLGFQVCRGQVVRNGWEKPLNRKTLKMKYLEPPNNQFKMDGNGEITIFYVKLWFII